MVTDKNKEQFEKWFIEFHKLHEYMNINYFLQIREPLEMFCSIILSAPIILSN